MRWASLRCLERDADDHLANRGAGERISPAERLRAKQHMDAKRAPLPHDTVHQQCRALRHAVILDEQLLEFINQQQRARHRLRATRAFVTGDVLRAEFAEEIAAALEFFIHALQDAQTKFPVALNGNDARVR